MECEAARAAPAAGAARGWRGVSSGKRQPQRGALRDGLLRDDVLGELAVVGGGGRVGVVVDALRKVSQVIFCGYSFPDADMHIKYLLKRAQTNRGGNLNVTVVNHFEGKSAAECLEEEGRYRRFLGSNVTYTKMSFEDFAADPVAVLWKP